MKKRQQLKKQVVTALELPEDLAYHDTIVTVTGKSQAIVENYKSIQLYTKEKIMILTLRGSLTICGKDLNIPWYTPDEMQISGKICEIFMK